jgi:hypothetical protein
MDEELTIIGIAVDCRAERAPEVQEVITRYGEEIVCRMGVPTAAKKDGLITLIFNGKAVAADEFYHELEAIEGLNVQMMRFGE